MSIKTLTAAGKFRFSVSLVCAAVFVLAFPFDCAAQAGNRQKPARGGVKLPRVGTIKDYPATGLTVGCGNAYYYFEHQARMQDADYVFISSGDGKVAWMNLDGRDVRLRLVKRPSPKGPPYRFDYRWRNVSIAAIFQGSQPGKALSGEEEPLSGLKIIVRRGRIIKNVRALGESDC